eukprot:jgi/Psemu1/324691/estExt_fgenesh1_pg.C_1680009
MHRDTYDTATTLRKKRSKKKTGNERNIGSGSKKKAGKTTNRNETSQEKTSKTEKKTPAKRKSGGSGKKDPITIDDDDDDNDNEETTTTKTATPNEKKKKPKVTLDSFDVVLPSSIIDGGGCSSENQCTLLVEVTDPKDAIALGEFGGSVGAIGRFESDPNGITLDLKGNQYRGSLLPGPTCMVVGFPSSFGFKKKETATATTGATEDHQAEEGSPSATAIVGTLRVEGITDEYATLVQIDDHMKKLDAIVTGNQNDVDDGHDENENENYHTNDKSDKGQQ